MCTYTWYISSEVFVCGSEVDLSPTNAGFQLHKPGKENNVSLLSLMGFRAELHKLICTLFQMLHFPITCCNKSFMFLQHQQGNSSHFKKALTLGSLVCWPRENAILIQGTICTFLPSYCNIKILPAENAIVPFLSVSSPDECKPIKSMTRHD